MFDPEVTYRGDRPALIEVRTKRWGDSVSKENIYHFTVNGSTAQLSGIESDGEVYNVAANEETRNVAADAVRKLPFVQAVVMFDDE